MNAKTTAVLLALGCLLMGGALWYRHSVAVESEDKHVATVNQLSNEWKEASAKLDDQKAVNLTLERDLANRAEEVKVISNNLATTSANLAKTEADAKAALELAAAEIKSLDDKIKVRDEKIKNLEGETDDLTKRRDELTGSIAKLQTQIADTERKLQASEGDREFLMKELKRLQAEKAELEKRFQDLAILREQVRKLKDELSIARRLDWIRRGIYGDVGKGAELLQRGFSTVAPAATNAPAAKSGQYNLDVEVRRDGTVKVGTNAPATNAPAIGAPVTPVPKPTNSP